MPVTREELDSFHSYAAAKISNGGAELSWGDLFELWRMENPTEAERAEMREIVRKGFEDIDAGRFMAADEFNVQLEREFGPIDR
jgi:hypothetical protein